MKVAIMQTKIRSRYVIASLILAWPLAGKAAICQRAPHHSRLFLPLLNAINRGEASKVHELLLHNADANEIGTFYNDGLTPTSPLLYAVGVLTACDRDNKRRAYVTKICKDLVHFGAKIDQRGDYNRTPLMLSAELTGTEVLTYFLTHGAKINSRDNNRETPLMYAVQENTPTLNIPNSQAAILLLNHGALVDLKDAEGDTALMLLAHYFPADPNHAKADKIATAIAQRLLIRGANPKLHNNTGQTALSIAQVNKMLQLSSLLERVTHKSK